MTKCCRIRELKIKSKITNEERTLTHYNFLTWPDFGTPDEEDYEVIDDIVGRIAKVDNDERNKSKIIVH